MNQDQKQRVFWVTGLAMVLLGVGLWAARLMLVASPGEHELIDAVQHTERLEIIANDSEQTEPPTPAPEPEPATATMSGRIVDAQGDPIDGAWVCEFWPQPDGLCARSDAAGGFHLEGLRPETNWVEVSAPHFEPLSHQQKLAPGEELEDLLFELRRGGLQLHGVVRTLEGEPLAGAQFAIAAGAFTVSDADGQFELWTSDTASRELSAAAPGYADIDDWDPRSPARSSST